MTALYTTDCVTTRDQPKIDSTLCIDELLRMLVEGDPAAWEEIVRRYRGLVVATVRSLGLQEADVLDAVQMTWLRLAENAHKVHSPQRFGGWLATTARREALHILRQHSKHQLVPTDVVATNVADPAVSPEQRLLHHETQRILGDLIAELSPLRRNLLCALFTDNPPSYAEVARTVGIAQGGVGPTRARALHQLRCQLRGLGLISGGEL
ncbi:MAG: RNA polymerase sigma factor [Pseudonocardiaceae bacterium]